jgi:hypothetical protein
MWLPVPVVVMVGLCFWGLGWAANKWGLNTVKRLVHEAGACERDGMNPEAEDAFRRAVAMFDSFLISPLKKREKSGVLASRLARFYLARTQKKQDSESFLVSYLYSHPGDEEVAEDWLNQIQSRGGLKEEHQELVYRIGTALPKNGTIQLALARFYLLLERTDFPALQTYRRICQTDGQAPRPVIDDLARLFIRERRSDEWALKIYLQALEGGFERSEILGGLAACVRWIPETEQNKSLLSSAYDHLKDIDKSSLRAISAAYKPQAPAARAPKMKDAPAFGRQIADSIHGLSKSFVYGPISVLRWTANRIKSLAYLIPSSPKAKRTAGGLLLCALTVGIAILMINTVSHLVKTENTAGSNTDSAEIVVTDPFTIQVAAYLNAVHAHRFVEQLKKQGLDAYWTEAMSGNKKWYQVRVSHFADKKSARKYAETLKAKGVIEDYYVANYRR